MSVLPHVAHDTHLSDDGDSPSSALSRRSLLRASGALAGAGALGLLGAAPAAAAEADVTRRAARPADQLLDAFGVIVVTSTANGVWGQREGMADRLRELGSRYIRTRLFDGNRGQIEYLRRLNAQGVRANLVMGDPLNPTGTPEQLVALAAGQLPGGVASFEGANEWNLKGRRNWVSELRGHQSRLYRAVKSDRRVGHLPVLAPSLGRREGFEQLGNITNICDFGNLHLYTGGFQPSYRIDDQLRVVRAVSGSKPVMITETGWHNARNTRATHNYTSEEVAGIYAPRLLLEHVLRGTRRMFIYQLADYRPDAGLSDHEAHFGLLRADLSRKPAFHALANTLALLRDSGPPARTTGALDYGTAASSSDVRQLLVQRRDGTFVLFLWRDVAIWDPIRERTVGVSSRTVDVRLGRTANVRTHRPASNARTSATRTSRVSVPLSGEVVALEIDSL